MKEESMLKRHLFMAVLLFVFTTPPVQADSARVSVLIVDQATGDPLESVRVTGYFTVDIGWRAWTESSVPNKDSALTDKDGLCRLEGKTNCGKVGCWVDDPPAGYYCPSRGWGHTYTEKNLFGVWQPDNLVATIRLQRVEHPIPLMVKYVRLADINNGLGGASWTNCTFRYDLLKGDWLPPFGKGETDDLEINSRFELTGKAKMFKPQEGKWGEVLFYTLHNTVSTASKDDRLEEVTFDPRAGIRVRKVEKEMSARSLCFRIGDKKTADPKDDEWCGERIKDCEGDAAYVFRIRTRYDEKGKIKSAYYGKIYGKFKFQGNETVGLKSIDFLYYLNPTPLDRNLEWDMKTNLCPGRRQSVQKRP